MSGTNSTSRRRRGGLVAFVLVLGLVLAAGCGAQEDRPADESFSPTTTAAAAMTATTAAGSSTATYASDGTESGAPGGDYGVTGSGEGSALGTVQFAASLDRKIISNADVLIEVERGKFQVAFDTALLLADKFGGYVVSSNSTASEDEGAMRSGTIALRVPETAFAQALSDVAKLGEVKSRNVDTQDVTEEYLDLAARLKNAEAQEKAFLSLMDKAKTIDEILQVRQVLSQTQVEVEQLKGRIRFLDEHTSFSTLTISVYEVGTEVATTGSWGFVAAAKDALHAFVGSINAIMVFFGGALPILVLLAILAWIAYRLIRPLAARLSGRNRPQDQ
ncbi:MAG: DUF4349 domain-containing protein [Thermoleophilia bacterium]